MKIKFFFAWFDFWVGLYYDTKKHDLYICFIPCLVMKIELTTNRYIQAIKDVINGEHL